MALLYQLRGGLRMTLEIEVVEDPARACSVMLVGAAAGGGHVVLAGGSTPKAAYNQLVDAVGDVGINLTATTFWFGDERCVPPDDERSNFLMVKRAMLDRLPPENQPRVHRVQGELGPAEAADAYERDLREAGPPEFEMLLLGVGPDGHVASLFPDQPSLSERSRLVVGVEQAGLEPFVPRVSFTLPAVASARRVVVLVAGSSKADAVAAAFGPESQPDPHIPSSMLVPLAKHLTVLLDEAAAEKL
jgi:6-phosphogluconolactonase